MPDVLVIGSSGGIGRVCVDQLLQRGHSVVGMDLVPFPGAADPGYTHLTADGSELAQVQDAFADFSDVRHVINVAGGATPLEVGAEAELISYGAMEETWKSNVETSLVAVDALAWHMSGLRRAAGTADASVTLCSSINAIGNYSFPVYSAMKSAIEGLVTSMAIPLGAKGVRINCVRLGTVVTDASRKLHGDAVGHYERLKDQSALGRFATDQEAAAALIALGLDLTGCTGVTMTVDCGQSIPGRRAD
jgi:NAD(P)-dependent dehydrogenase (short-subunit alcohol dehydrogenase family)